MWQPGTTAIGMDRVGVAIGGIVASEWIERVWLLEGLWQPGTTSIRMDRVGVAIGGIVAARDY